MKPIDKDARQIDADFNDFDLLSSAVARWCSSFQQDLPNRPAAVMDNPVPVAAALPELGQGAEHAFMEFVEHIAPGLSASSGPRYFGFVTGGATPAAILGDWLVSATDQNVMVPGDSISSALEIQTLAWLRDLFLLGDDFDGTLTTGATSANMLGLLCARQFSGARQGIDIAKEGMRHVDIEVFSACPHASIKKVMSFVGLGRDAIKSVPCLDGTETMDVQALARMLQNSTSPGKIVVASAATVTGTDFDELEQIVSLCKKHDAWLHVDAAFGLFSRLMPERIELTKGIENADSISCDGHKWLNVPYDSGIFFTRHIELLQEVCTVAAPYLDNKAEIPAFMDRGIENSRRFRALPIWLTLKAYGREGYQNLVENNCQQASYLANWLDQSEGYELLTPCHLNVVVFAPNFGEGEVNGVDRVLDAINRSGKVFLTPGKWQGKSGFRAAFSNWRTGSEDLDILCEVLDDLAHKP